MDANLHLFLNLDLETLIKYEDRYHEIVLEAAQIALKTGQTTVFDTWGPRAALEAHTTSVESLDMAIEAGVDIVTHGDISGPTRPIPDETIRKLVERGVAVSALPVTQRHVEAMEKHAPNRTLLPYFKVAKTNHRNMIKAGVSLLVSTDAGIEHPLLSAESQSVAADTVDPRVKLGEGHFNALVALEEEGMDRMEILKAATSNIAKAYKLADIGSLEAGKIADVVILDANPLQSARNYRRIHAVIKDGKVVDLRALPVAPIISVGVKAR